MFRNEAAEALMALALQLVSSHLLGALDIEKALSVQESLASLLLPHAESEADTLKRPNCPRLFLLDGCSINLPLGPLSTVGNRPLHRGCGTGAGIQARAIENPAVTRTGENGTRRSL